MTDWTMVKASNQAATAMDVPIKYCKTCNIWRPPRVHHCRMCDNCIETQDHHCVWLNNCVGRRNYQYFFTFVASGTCLGLFLTFASLGVCLRYQSTAGISFASAINTQRVAFALFIYGLLITPYPASLVTYHLFLVGRGETTREYLNASNFLKKDRHRPFDQGKLLRNWIVVLMRSRPPSYLPFRDNFAEGDQRFGVMKGTQGQSAFIRQQHSRGMEMQQISDSVRPLEGHTGPQRV
jgi:palmitoyltransferase ZDHHC9/14/18